MKSNKIYLRTCLYILIVSVTIIVVVWLKQLLVFVGDEYLYAIPFLGDILRSIEIIELANLVVFAILGMFFGMATAFLPKTKIRYLSIALLTVAVPLLFSITSFIRYQQWLQKVAIQEKVSHARAKRLTDSYLSSKIGKRGFWGFYQYTAQFPIVPTNKKQIDEIEDMDRRLKLGLSKLLSKAIGDRPRLVNFFFVAQGWIIRLFYFLIAAFATIFHFQDGTLQAERMMAKLTENTKKDAKNAKRDGFD